MDNADANTALTGGQGESRKDSPERDALIATVELKLRLRRARSNAVGPRRLQAIQRLLSATDLIAASLVALTGAAPDKSKNAKTVEAGQ